MRITLNTNLHQVMAPVNFRQTKPGTKIRVASMGLPEICCFVLARTYQTQGDLSH